MRENGRKPDELRPLSIQANVLKNAHGSVLISAGNTQVLCTAMLEEGVPPFLAETGNGWLTAEYSMIPASTPHRKKRDGVKQDGRGVEIQRLIGRSLRSVCNFEGMGEYTIYIDCDVLNADGGTRTASISGAFIAAALCIDKAVREGMLTKSPLTKHVAAVSAGIVEDTPLLDLCYAEDSGAQADMNMVAADDGNIGEIQISGEKRTVTEEEFTVLMALCKKGIHQIIARQKEILKEEGITV
ncbi:ribonuclease PH [Christensenella tenuis]|uniref:Ribonuclease PH n=1 Tax=Christensenella tenuis TaxID=2763033 RepID=A0ABR7EB02_9FIRM|nr:ribonuclease PH [Christensenella tenuis]MBC5646936.1 ribonuclease PH [Christensenella tenuis]